MNHRDIFFKQYIQPSVLFTVILLLAFSPSVLNYYQSFHVYTFNPLGCLFAVFPSIQYISGITAHMTRNY